jgi:hypothetical protein
VALKHQDLFFNMSTLLKAQDMIFEDACDGIQSVGPDGVSVGSMDVDEELDFGSDFPLQTATNALASTGVVAFEQLHETVAWPPRMVSIEDMSSLRETTTKKEVDPTPYYSLRLLVKNKQQGMKRSLEGRTCIEDNSTSSCFLHALKQTQHAPKRRRVADPFLLHRVCCSRNLTLDLENVQGILREDPAAASRQHTLFTEEKVYNYLSHHLETKRVRESYSYPINMALEKDADTTVLKSLIDADKTVLARKDGLEQEGSLHILLKHQRNNTDAVDAILAANPSAVLVEDRHFDTPLHVACRSGASIDVIRHLWIMYPGALAKRNFQGLTPLDVAQTNGQMCSDEVAYFLWLKLQEGHLTL